MIQPQGTDCHRIHSVIRPTKVLTTYCKLSLGAVLLLSLKPQISLPIEGKPVGVEELRFPVPV